MVELIFYHLIPTFNDPESFEKIVEQRENACNQHFLVSKTEVIILATLNLLSANAFNLVIAKICHLGRR